MSGGCLAAWLGCQLSCSQFAHLAVAGRPFSDIHCPELIAAKWSLVLVARHQLQVVPMVATTPRA